MLLIVVYTISIIYICYIVIFVNKSNAIKYGVKFKFIDEGKFF